MEKIKTTFIGVGYRGMQLLKLLRHIPFFEIVAVADPEISDVGIPDIVCYNNGNDDYLNMLDVHKPDLVIFDEPTNGLDPNQIMEIRHLIRDIAKDRTVILSTHILTEVQAVCDHILMIEEGKLVFMGTVDEFDNYIIPNSLYVSMVDPPLADELAKIEGVLGVEELGNRNFRIRFTESQEVIDQIVKLSAANDWRLSEVRVEKSSLDNIFAELSKKAH